MEPDVYSLGGVHLSKLFHDVVDFEEPVARGPLGTACPGCPVLDLPLAHSRDLSEFHGRNGVPPDVLDDSGVHGRSRAGLGPHGLAVGHASPFRGTVPHWFRLGLHPGFRLWYHPLETEVN